MNGSETIGAAGEQSTEPVASGYTVALIWNDGHSGEQRVTVGCACKRQLEESCVNCAYHAQMSFAAQVVMSKLKFDSAESERLAREHIAAVHSASVRFTDSSRNLLAIARDTENQNRNPICKKQTPLGESSEEDEAAMQQFLSALAVSNRAPSVSKSSSDMSLDSDSEIRSFDDAARKAAIPQGVQMKSKNLTELEKTQQGARKVDDIFKHGGTKQTTAAKKMEEKKSNPEKQREIENCKPLKEVEEREKNEGKKQEVKKLEVKNSSPKKHQDQKRSDKERKKQKKEKTKKELGRGRGRESKKQKASNKKHEHKGTAKKKEDETKKVAVENQQQSGQQPRTRCDSKSDSNTGDALLRQVVDQANEESETRDNGASSSADVTETSSEISVQLSSTAVAELADAIASLVASQADELATQTQTQTQTHCVPAECAATDSEPPVAEVRPASKPSDETNHDDAETTAEQPQDNLSDTLAAEPQRTTLDTGDIPTEPSARDAAQDASPEDENANATVLERRIVRKDDANPVANPTDTVVEHLTVKLEPIYNDCELQTTQDCTASLLSAGVDKLPLVGVAYSLPLQRSHSKHAQEAARTTDGRNTASIAPRLTNSHKETAIRVTHSRNDGSNPFVTCTSVAFGTEARWNANEHQFADDQDCSDADVDDSTHCWRLKRVADVRPSDTCSAKVRRLDCGSRFAAPHVEATTSTERSSCCTSGGGDRRMSVHNPVPASAAEEETLKLHTMLMRRRRETFASNNAEQLLLRSYAQACQSLAIDGVETAMELCAVETDTFIEFAEALVCMSECAHFVAYEVVLANPGIVKSFEKWSEWPIAHGLAHSRLSFVLALTSSTLSLLASRFASKAYDPENQRLSEHFRDLKRQRIAAASATNDSVAATGDGTPK